MRVPIRLVPPVSYTADRLDRRFQAPLHMLARAGEQQARQLLLRYNLVPREVDIQSDPRLCDRFGEVIPVVEIDGRIRFRGRVDEVLLKRIVGAPDD